MRDSKQHGLPLVFQRRHLASNLAFLVARWMADSVCADCEMPPRAGAMTLLAPIKTEQRNVFLRAFETRSARCHPPAFNQPRHFITTISSGHRQCFVLVRGVGRGLKLILIPFCTSSIRHAFGCARKGRAQKAAALQGKQNFGGV